MRQWNAREAPQDFCEPAVNMPVYVAGIASVTASDGLLNIAYYVDLPSQGCTEHAICLRVIMPVGALEQARVLVNGAVSRARMALNA